MKKSFYSIVFFVSLLFITHTSATVLSADCKSFDSLSTSDQTAKVVIDYEKYQVLVTLSDKYYVPFRLICVIDPNKDFSCVDIFVRSGHSIYLDATYITVSMVENELRLKVEEDTAGQLQMRSYDCKYRISK